ncbi:excinuclease ABC subunit C [Sphingobacterium allocomposti]|jgi:excinuclease ABC subunit C|uniref:UvrABC system protein C n=1 Tax=Sphingobacterium allocomposti TaxID=415956 RepID=A0A5S5DAA0_9SPHI|nr:excinuclease ABC subunit UvrC [Sphingobacterium composti Yoo et al. 2007 non Ten et al. 2007]TYP92930.1 excinuclease ABC subunit C [Sphingobacterium composti Yoo et al. 2007 non Ten et al. 2007]HLS96709.1 excinuclease ABC subunit UvrC [Sphingobacterium sp.]
MSSFDYREELKKIPHKPGVYQYFDKNNELIYVGKAKDLRNRVGSYFVNDQQLNSKTRVLVRKINRIAFTIVDTEIDAWLLENNLIKKHKPRYNVMLKDDKTYPWIVIKNEHFPRIYWTRKYVKDGSRYYGPYASVGMMHIILDTIRELFPLRTCNLNLAPENIAKGKYKVCLEYQIGNCKGPCEGYQLEEDYNQNLADIKHILNGRIAVVTGRLKSQMQDAVNDLNFELAHKLKGKLDKLANYQSKSTVVSSSISNVDVFSIASDESYAFVNYLKVVHGVVIQTQTLEMKKRLDESEEELLALAIPEIRSRFKSTSKEIIVPFDIHIEESDDIRFTIPKAGEKKNLLELSLKNVAYFKKERMLQYERLNPEVKTERILKQMQKDLRLTDLPRHIECFDNSNIQGNYPVSAVVVFKDAKPSKKDYRHFNVKTVVGPNDFATMEEAVFRRYRRLLDEDQDLPQLIIIDGGKGQLGAALKSLKLLGIEKKVTVIGIAKRLEELYYPGDQYPLYLDKKSETLKIIQHLRDEAHRFGITFHRHQRSRKTFVSELENIPGIGKTSVEKLLKTFKSAKRVKEATDEELRKVLNPKQVKALRHYFEG